MKEINMKMEPGSAMSAMFLRIGVFQEKQDNPAF
jgi:hypothetical protein